MADLLTPGANAFLNGTALDATLYVQLHLGDPGTNGTANVAVETRRKSFTRTTSTVGTVDNVALIEWLNAAATETITHITVWSASSGGTAWFADDIANVAVNIGEVIQIDVGTLNITVPVW